MPDPKYLSNPKHKILRNFSQRLQIQPPTIQWPFHLLALLSFHSDILINIWNQIYYNTHRADAKDGTKIKEIDVVIVRNKIHIKATEEMKQFKGFVCGIAMRKKGSISILFFFGWFIFVNKWKLDFRDYRAVGKIIVYAMRKKLVQ